MSDYDETCPCCGLYLRDGHADDCELMGAYEALEKAQKERDEARSETNRLRADLDTVKKERDEARCAALGERIMSEYEIDDTCPCCLRDGHADDRELMGAYKALEKAQKERDEARREASRARWHSERILGLSQTLAFPWENDD